MRVLCALCAMRVNLIHDSHKTRFYMMQFAVALITTAFRFIDNQIK